MYAKHSFLPNIFKLYILPGFSDDPMIKMVAKDKSASCLKARIFKGIYERDVSKALQEYDKILFCLILIHFCYNLKD